MLTCFFNCDRAIICANHTLKQSVQKTKPFKSTQYCMLYVKAL